MKPDEVVWSGNETSLASLPPILEQARTAQKAWAALSGRERHDTISAFLDALDRRKPELAERMVLELGKLQGEAIVEVTKSLVEARWMLGRCLEATGEVMAQTRQGIRAMKIRRPRGVILAITPWNFPVLTPMRKIAPALVFGNAIVVKPSSDAPGAPQIIQEAADRIFPQGLVSTIYGDAKLANAAIRSPDVDAVTFTGSTVVGRKVMAAAAEGLKEVSLELGGKNPVIIHSADRLDEALDQTVKAAFANAGQRCTAVSRVLAHENLRADVLAGLKRRVESLVPGSGDGGKTPLAPLSTRRQCEKVCASVSKLDPSEAEIVTGGMPADIPGGGLFYQPTLIEVKARGCALNFEEVFGPVLGVEFYVTVEEAIERANAPAYGLTASVFASDLRTVRAFEEGIHCGMLHVNHGTFPDENMPFGGWKASGVGSPSVGQDAEHFFTRIQALYEGV